MFYPNRQIFSTKVFKLIVKTRTLRLFAGAKVVQFFAFPNLLRFFFESFLQGVGSMVFAVESFFEVTKMNFLKTEKYPK